MELFSQETLLQILTLACFGYMMGVLVMSIPLILQGIKNLKKTGLLNRNLCNILYVVFCFLAIATVFVVPSIMRKTHFVHDLWFGGVILLFICTITVLVLAKILVSLGIFSNWKDEPGSD